jgi:hypothetical protein
MDAAVRSPERNDLDAASQISKAIASVRSTKGRALERPKVVDKHAWFRSITGSADPRGFKFPEPRSPFKKYNKLTSKQHPNIEKFFRSHANSP